VPAGEKVIKQRRAYVADMQQPGGRRRYANVDGHDPVSREPIKRFVSANRRPAALAGTDADALFQGKNKNLSVARFACFGYFENDEENFSIFSTASGLLEQGGFFVFDFMNRGYVENFLVKESKGQIAGEEITQKRRIEGDRVIKDIIIRNNGDTKTFYESVKMYRLNELKMAITEKGLAIKETFGDFKGNKYIEESSPRIIIIAQK